MLSPCRDRHSSSASPVCSEFPLYFPTLLLEPLEARIAPAGIDVGALSGTPPSGSFNYTDAESPGGSTPFILAANSADPDIAALFAGSTDHYYIQIGKGFQYDALNIYTSAGLSQGVTVSSGISYLFFYDGNQDGIVQSGEMTGIAMSSGTSVQVFSAMGSVNGDILVNVNAKTGAFSSTDLNTDTKGVAGLRISGNLEGSLLSGGSISNVTISGSADSILTGTATSGHAYDLGGGQPQGQGVLNAFTPLAKQSGAAIANVTIGSVDLIQAGDGAAGKVGGSISNITIQSDTDGFVIRAGDGGDGGAGSNNGGAGGAISKVVVYGNFDGSLDDTISIQAGNGGNGTATGTGGAGGNVSNVWVGYEYSGKNLVKSSDFLGDFVYVMGGDGGDGKSGGRGGSLSDINIRTAPSDTVVLGPEIGLFAGAGGDALDAKGKSGDGGNINKFFVVSAYNGTLNPDPGLAVQAGHAGDASLANTSGKGGSVTNGIVLGKVIEVSSGNGSDAASKGGQAGSINGLHIAYSGDARLTQFNQPESHIDNIFAQEVTLLGGLGGSALTKGKGGTGGDILNVTAPDTDLQILVIAAGNGGGALDGTGANGGKINALRFDSDRSSSNEVAALVSTGNGGDGSKKAGNGGDILNSSLFLTEATITFTAGNGGNGGTGGNGGSIRSASFVASGDFSGNPGFITVLAGDGGNASDKFKAGNGGSILGTRTEKISILGDGDLTVLAGQGGKSNTGQVGNGGSLGDISLIANNILSSVDTRAGNAGIGLSASKGGNGGSITSMNVQAGLNINILAGNGSTGTQAGGNGGNIQTLAFSGFIPGTAPIGDITLRAGDGADGVNKGGHGGSLTNIVGYSSLDLAANIVFEAGTGGNADRNAGNGGSINGFTILGGKAEFSILAGHAGDSTSNGKGGNGGSVNQVAVAPLLVLRDIAAGDGGNSALSKGGNGGSVTGITANGNIGVMSGEAFGFGQAGGIFAGLGGTGGKGNGVAGNVTDIVANSIASIVAGRDASAIGLVSKVDGIFLNGSTQLTLNGVGGFSNSGTANIVGSSSLADPSVADGSLFHYTDNGNPAEFQVNSTNPWNPATDSPLDGLVAALVLTSRRNVAPNALLQPDGAGGYQMVIRSYNPA